MAERLTSQQPVTAAAIRAAVLRTLHQSAPEVDLAAVPETANLRRELDLDSVDFQNFVIGVSRELRVEIAEQDAPRLLTLAGCLEHLQGLRSAVD